MSPRSSSRIGSGSSEICQSWGLGTAGVEIEADTLAPDGDGPPSNLAPQVLSADYYPEGMPYPPVQIGPHPGTFRTPVPKAPATVPSPSELLDGYFSPVVAVC